MLIERNNYAALDQPVGPYVHAVKYNGLLFLSGLSAFGTPAQGQGIAEQARAIFEQIGRIAATENRGLESLLKVTIYVARLVDIAALRDALFSIYGSHLPASSLVQVAALFSDQIDIEIEAVLAAASA